ncbi:MAG: ATP-binding cassette domain-containing protein [Chloroflexi bacterium]|nr:ATP-binding cassette domain-containing protein [Chloroflexota bacterium]
MDNKWAIEFQNLTYHYPNMDRPSLANIQLNVAWGSFILLIGSTGSGKSTLMKLARGLYSELGGSLFGSIYANGRDLSKIEPYVIGDFMGIVFQNPAYQLHQPRVIDEIMSAPMYQGLAWSVCVERAERSIEGILDKDLLVNDPKSLSTGQQQKVALAASLAMDARILLLDEPLSYLDNTSQKDFVEILQRLKVEGKTIIMATHDIDPVVNVADRIILLNDGHLIKEGNVDDVLYSEEFKEKFGYTLWLKVGDRLKNQGYKSVPKSSRDIVSLFHTKISGPTNLSNSSPTSLKEQITKPDKNPCIRMSDVTFGYSTKIPTIKNLSLDIYEGDVLGIIGRNGSGKTTLALLLLGLLKPQKGSIEIFGEDINKIQSLASKIGYVTQDPRNMLFERNVFDECMFGPKSLRRKDAQTIVTKILNELNLMRYSKRDPFSLSGGEQRLLSIADVLANDPNIIIFDEPEFGLDPRTWTGMERTITKLQEQKKTVVIITHRLEMTPFLCNQIALLGNGQIISVGDPMDVLRNKQLLVDAQIEFGPLSNLIQILRKDAATLSSEETFTDLLVDAIIR